MSSPYKYSLSWKCVDILQLVRCSTESVKKSDVVSTSCQAVSQSLMHAALHCSLPPRTSKTKTWKVQSKLYFWGLKFTSFLGVSVCPSPPLPATHPFPLAPAVHCLRTLTHLNGPSPRKNSPNPVTGGASTDGLWNEIPCCWNGFSSTVTEGQL